MSKPFKIALWIVGVIIVLLIVLAVSVTLMFDPNDYRDDIERITQEKTGRELKINGDIKLSVFPWLGIELGQTTFGNAQGFGSEPFARIDSVEASVKLMPLLFDKQIQIGTVELNGMGLNLARNEQGVGNWEDLVEKLGEDAESPPEPRPQPPTEETGGFDMSNVGVGSVEIHEASLVFDDRQAKTRYAIESINLETGELRLDEPVNLNLNFVFDSKAPAMNAQVDLVGLINTDLEMQRYAIDKLTLNVIARGEAIPGGEQQLEFTGNAAYESKDGHLTVGNSQLQTAGITLKLAAEGNDMAGDSPEISGTLSAATFSPRQLLDTLKIEIPEPRDNSVLKKASLDARFASNLKSAALPDIKLVLDDTTISGRATLKDFATQALNFALKIDTIDVDRYLPPPTPEGEAPQGDEDGAAADIDSIEIPVELLEQFDAEGTLDIGTLRISGMNLKDVSLKISAPKSKTKTVTLGANLYEGAIETTTRISPGARPGYSTDTRLSSIAVGSLLNDFTGKDMLSGTGDVAFKLDTTGRTVGDLRSGLDGTLALSLVDGSIKGFNVGQAIRKAKAALNGEQLAVSEPQQTDFAALTASGNIVDGVYQSTALDLKNPLFRLGGEGNVDLVREQIDFLAKPTIAATSKGQGGKELDELSGLTIPVRITGPLSNPKLSLDLGNVLKDKAKARAKEELEEHEDEIKEKIDEKLGGGAADALRGLFGRSKKNDEKKQEEAPATSPDDGT